MMLPKIQDVKFSLRCYAALHFLTTQFLFNLKHNHFCSQKFCGGKKCCVTVLIKILFDHNLIDNNQTTLQLAKNMYSLNMAKISKKKNNFKLAKHIKNQLKKTK